MKKNDLVFGFILVALGLLTMILKGEIINIVATILGVVLIVYGIVDVVHQNTTKGVISIIIGAAIILLGWLFIQVALYIIGGILIVYGVLDLINRLKTKIIFNSTLKKVIYYLIPVLYLVAGGCLLFNQGGTINFVFIFSGLIILINGILVIIDSFKKQK